MSDRAYEITFPTGDLYNYTSNRPGYGGISIHVDYEFTEIAWPDYEKFGIRPCPHCTLVGKDPDDEDRSTWVCPMAVSVRAESDPYYSSIACVRCILEASAMPLVDPIPCSLIATPSDIKDPGDAV